VVDGGEAVEGAGERVCGDGRRHDCRVYDNRNGNAMNPACTKRIY
jgi:hypothetical protein